MSLREVVTPALPIGWLFSLAIRHFHVPASSIDSAADWDSLSNLATDFASCLDCQRYSMFEATNLHPHEFRQHTAGALRVARGFLITPGPPDDDAGAPPSAVVG